MEAVIYDLIYMLPLCIMALSASANITGDENHIGTFLIMGAAIAVALFVKHGESRMKYLFVAAPAMILSGMILLQKPEERITFLSEHSRDLLVFGTGIGICILTSFLVSYKWCKRLLFIGLLAGLGFMMYSGYGETKAAVAAALLPLLSILAEEIQRGWEKSGYTALREHLVYISPFLVGICFLVYLLPASKDPFGWQLARRIWERAVEQVHVAGNWFHMSDEDYGGIIGFSDEVRFSGAMKKQEKEMIELTFGSGGAAVVYLTGEIFDTFDGREWTTRDPRTVYDPVLDTIETLCAVNEYDRDNFTDYLRSTDISLRFLDFRTRYVFLPGKAVTGMNFINEMGAQTQDGGLLAKKQMAYNSSYRVKYYRMNQDRDEFAELVGVAQLPERDQWEYASKRYAMSEKEALDVSQGRSENAIAYERYLEYRERIRNYDLPETIVSDKMQAYLDQLMDGATSDIEKLSRLEFVLSVMHYNDNPGRLPASVKTPADFLDHLFFETQEGYCVHYATAFVLLARHLGIPARYVQGFWVHRETKTTMLLTSSMAHAWPEVYLENFGWVAFEPTPGRKIKNSWQISKDTEEASSLATAQNHESEEEKEQFPILAQKDIEQEEKKAVRIGPILITGGCTIAFLILFLFADRLLTMYWYRKLDDWQRFHVICKRCLLTLRFLGFRPTQGETLAEFAERVGEEIPKEALEFIPLIEKVHYAECPVESQMCEQAHEALRILLSLLKEISGLWYWISYFRIIRIDNSVKKTERKD